MKKEIHQFSTINALMSGLFGGFFSIKDIKAYGNFGLGCSDGLMGEVIVKDHIFMEAKDNHVIRTMDDNERLPFAQVTTFNPDKTIEATYLNKTNLYSTLAKHILLDNLFLAVKIEGVFDQLKVRTPNDNGQSYKDAIEVSKNQIVREFSSIEGTLVGFWTPKLFQNISVAGFHVHFISKDGLIGGHVIDFDMKKGTLSYEVKFNLSLNLPNESSYLEKNLNIDNMDDIIKKVEN